MQTQTILPTPTINGVSAIATVDEPSTESARRREVISETISSVANGVIANISDLRRQLDDLEGLVLRNAAIVTDSLTQHANICDSVQIEVNRVTSVVAELRKVQMAQSRDLSGTSKQ